MSTELYDEKFYKRRTTYQKRAPLMCNGIIELFKPISVIDCGCALGDLVAEFLHQGIKSEGIEGSSSVIPFIQCPKENMYIYDLSKALPTLSKYSVVTCFEVAEHIEPQFVEVFIDNLCGLANTIVMSVCDYGSTTKVHPNVQPRSYWIEKFEKRFFYQSPVKEAALKISWDPIKKYPAVQEAYRNLIVFERETFQEKV